jgi:hypothetical protein
VTSRVISAACPGASSAKLWQAGGEVRWSDLERSAAARAVEPLNAAAATSGIAA